MPFATFSPSVQYGRFATLAYPTVVPVTKTLTTAGGVITLTPTELLGGLIRVDCQDAQTLTTPTAAAIVAAIQGVQIGCSFEVDVLNYGDSLLTLALGTGVTKLTIAAVSPVLTMATLTGKRLRFVVTSNVVGSEAIDTYASAGAIALA